MITIHSYSNSYSNSKASSHSPGENKHSRDRVLYQSLTPAQFAAVIRSGWRQFSADSAEQKFFYPKCRLAYAEMIARMFNVAHYSAAYVVQFRLPLCFLQRYQIQSIAYEEHQEYRIPTADLAAMNQHIVGRIEVVSAFWQEGETHAHNLVAELACAS